MQLLTVVVALMSVLPLFVRVVMPSWELWICTRRFGDASRRVDAVCPLLTVLVIDRLHFTVSQSLAVGVVSYAYHWSHHHRHRLLFQSTEQAQEQRVSLAELRNFRGRS
jgi:hypothetical protein